MSEELRAWLNELWFPYYGGLVNGILADAQEKAALALLDGEKGGDGA